MTLAEIENALTTGLTYVQALAPLAGALGGPAGAAAATIVETIATETANIVGQVEGDAEIIASGDLTRIRALQAELQSQNAALAAQIAAS